MMPKRILMAALALSLLGGTSALADHRTERPHNKALAVAVAASMAAAAEAAAEHGQGGGQAAARKASRQGGGGPAWRTNNGAGGTIGRRVAAVRWRAAKLARSAQQRWRRRFGGGGGGGGSGRRRRPCLFRWTGLSSQPRSGAAAAKAVVPAGAHGGGAPAFAPGRPACALLSSRAASEPLPLAWRLESAARLLLSPLGLRRPAAVRLVRAQEFWINDYLDYGPPPRPMVMPGCAKDRTPCWSTPTPARWSRWNTACSTRPVT